MLNYAENMLKICWNSKDFIFLLRKEKKRNQIKNPNFIISGEAPDQRMPPPANFRLLRPWVDYQKTRCSWVLVHRPSYNQADLSLSSILEEKLNFKPSCGLASTLTSLLRTKAWKILKRSPDWFLKLLSLCFPSLILSFHFSFCNKLTKSGRP